MSRLSKPVTALLACIFLAVLVRTAWLSDDALITLRTVLNVTHGYGLTFNVAERVQTFTHPLWLFLLTAAYLIVGNVYYATFALAMAVSLLVFWLAVRGAASAWQAALVAVALLCSKAFVDFATSGLENPLSNLLLLGFVAVATRPRADGRPRIGWLWLLASLLYLARPDDVLIVAPALVVTTFRFGIRRAASPVTLGLLPAIGWTLFSLVYYGFPFPNTAYAKLAHGIDPHELWHQGALYLVDAIDRDPITLVAAGLAVVLGVRQRGPARWLAAGIVLTLAYIVSIGGDFMAGRFVVLPFFAAVIVLGRLVEMDGRTGMVVAGLLLAMGVSSTQLPLRSDSAFQRGPNKPTGIVDERAVYFQTQSLVLANRASFAEPDWPRVARLPRPMSVLDTCGLMGAAGLDWGPLTHLLDECALADPLLARLPAVFNEQWRPGHFRRLIPDGYRKSLEERANLIPDRALHDYYDDLMLVTRGRYLLSRDRLAAIWRMNTGGDDHLVDRRFFRHGGYLIGVEDMASIVPDGAAEGTPGVRSLKDPLTVVCPDRTGRRTLDVSLESDDQYELLFLKHDALVARMELGPIPEYRRKPGMVSVHAGSAAQRTGARLRHDRDCRDRG